MTTTTTLADLDDVRVLPEDLRPYALTSTWAIDTADESWALLCASDHLTVVDDPEGLGSTGCRVEDENEDTGRSYRCGLALNDLVVVAAPDERIVRP